MPVMAGAVYRSEIDNSSYWSAPVPAVTAGDFAFVWFVEMANLYSIVNNSTENASNVAQEGYISLGKTVATYGAVNNFDTYVRVRVLNGGEPGTLQSNVAAAGNNGSSGIADTITKTPVQLNDRLVVVVQRNGATGKNELKVWNARTNAVTTEWSITANTGFTMAATSWRLGDGTWSSVMQAFGVTSRAFSDSEIAAIGGGADLDSIVPSGNRRALWLFDTTAASIPSVWGSAGAATRQGSWTNPGRVVGAPLPTTSAAGLTVNEPRSFGFISINDDGTPPTYTWSGTYVGFTPTALQARVVDYAGTVVKDWTDLGSFTASAGTWSGTLVVPIGSLYFIEVRDKTTPTIIRNGVRGWRCGAVVVAMGQSPHVIFYDDLYAEATPSSCPHSTVIPGKGQIFNVTPAGFHAGRGLTQAVTEWASRTSSIYPGGVPIMTVHTAAVGTSSADWKVQTGTQWTRFLAALDFAKPQRVLLSWLNGAAGVASIATEKANHQTIINNLGTDLGSRGITWRYRILPHNRDQSNTSANGFIRRAQQEIFIDQQDPKKFLMGPWWVDMGLDPEAFGTAQAATSTTITLDANDASYSSTTRSIEITAGTGAGQVRSGPVATATKVMTVTTAWDVVPDSTSVYRTWGTAAHPNRIGIDNFATRYGVDTAHHFGYTSSHGRGPRITSASRPQGGDGSVIDVWVTHTRQGMSLRTPHGSTSGIPGFEVFVVASNGGITQLTVASATIAGPRSVRLTLSAAPTSGQLAGLVVRYGYNVPVPTADWFKVGGGLDDVLYDDSGIAPKGGLPLYSTLADVPVAEQNPPLSAAQTAAFFAA